MILMVPPVTPLYPTLGPQVCAFIEQNMVFGPGDLRGQPMVLDEERLLLLYRMYEVYPKGHPKAGRRRFKRVGLSLPKGVGKALALDTPIPTPDGWITMGEIQVGDSVLGRDGRPCRVLSATPPLIGASCYRVLFNDGTSIVADAEHLWYTEIHDKMGGQSGLKTTLEIRQTLYWHSRKPYSRHRVPVAAPLDLPAKTLPIDPYMLGIWLGDGRSDDAEITVSSADLSCLEEQAAAVGYYTSTPKPDRRRPQTLAVRVSTSPIVRGRPATHTLKGALRALGVLENKHIPAVYLRGSLAQRLALLQGLFDTDGTAGETGCEFYAKNERLARQVLELARSVGLRPVLREKRATLNGRDCGICFCVRFTPRDDVPVFRLPRKQEASKRTATKVSQALSRTIRSVEPVPSVPVRCIAVDSADHLYLAGESMVPTHNTELAAMIAVCELHPEGPVRCTGFTKKGEPIGGPVTDPYIPLIAYTEEQSDELAFSAMRVMLENSTLKDDFDIGLERILRKKGDGKAEALSGNPNARDGARTTFCVLDETHRWVLARQLQSHTVMQTNIPKRKIADGWLLEVTTAPEPGAGSVAERTMEYAQAVTDGRVSDSSLFFFHRQASDAHDLTKPDGRRAAIIEASGPASSFRDVDAIEALWNDPGADVAYLERVYCNRLVKGSTQAFDVMRFKALAKTQEVPTGAFITVGFDGSQFHDATGIVCTEIPSGYQWVEALWECPPGADKRPEPWQVPGPEVDAIIHSLFDRFNVWRLYADPPYWQSWVSKWQGDFGKERVIEWLTNRPKQMAAALEAYDTAMKEKLLSHSGDKRLERHIGNARRKDLLQRDEQGKPLWNIQKERPDSPLKIDLAMAAVLSWEARTDAIASGATAEVSHQLFFVGGRS